MLNQKDIRVIELFAGIGGFRYGLEQASDKFKFVWANELDRYACQIYRKNFGGEIDKYACQVYRKNYGEGELYEGDITKIKATDIPDHDLLCAGFPCQSFSIAGKRAGFDDTRGTLFYEIIRIAKAKQPMYMLLENVKGLISHDKGNTLKVILDSLQELGYYTNWEVHNSKNYGVPQNRERIFFICRHIKGFAEGGEDQRISFSKKIIEEWLFQFLLNSLKEVKKLQEVASKDWVIGYLLCQEIKQNPNLSAKNIMDGITIPMAGNKSPLKEGVAWQNIATWLSKELGENLKEVNMFTISTVIKEITELKTYTYSKMFQVIASVALLLRNSQRNLWNEILSSLTLIKENTKYARINNKEKETVITEYSNLHITHYIQDPSRYFLIQYLRGEGGQKIFPIGEEFKDNTKQVTSIPMQATNTLRSNYSNGHANETYTTQGTRIRRLTPTECERLQGFPDGWTEGVSDTQRYKCLGNAVTTRVITAIGEKL